MSHKSLCVFGLLALACLILDAKTEENPSSAAGPTGDGRLPARRAGSTSRPRAGAGCPRNHAHRIRRRADGAVWCLHCDQAFFPRVAEWDAALRRAGV